jgi:calcineurin-like phosphoesterase family protein
MNIKKKTERELRYVIENLKGNKIYVCGNWEFKSKNN